MWGNIFKYENELTVSGLNNSLINEYILNYYEKYNKNVLVVAESLYDANNIYKGIQKRNENVCLFPMDEFATVLAISASPDLRVARIDTLNKISNNKQIVITNLSGFLKKIDKDIKKLEVNFNTKRNEIIKFLEDNSYVKTNLVSTTGEYAVRNFIIDVFPIESDMGIRIEFFGDDIDSIRYFDVESQISKKTIGEFTLYSFSDESSDEYENILDKLDDVQVFFIDYKKILNSYQSYVDNKEEFNIGDNYFTSFSNINMDNKIYINSYDDTPVCKDIDRYKSKDIINFNNNYENLYEYVNKMKSKYIVIFMMTNENLINKIISLFGNDISFEGEYENRVNIVKQDIEFGFVFDKYIVISEYDIENVKKKSVFINHYNIGRKIKGFDDLKKGDYIVHVVHGIGQYQGLVTLENNGIKKDYLLITYAGNDKIYVPASKIETIYKYSDSDTASPKLNSLNSNNWAKAKAKARSKIQDISGELIKLYAERELVVGDRYVETPEEEIFKNDFEYEETPDQTKSIKDILNDLSSSKPMDRLLCGDVGFGKTEVALRAAFKCVCDSKQCAILCPTTILAWQHYQTIINRFDGYPVRIELLSRFRTAKQQKEIVEKLKRGEIDIVVGTHRLVQKDVTFHDLGLAIIDEEQRFGVAHKERFKEICKNVDVLTLSATPIPRTLNMAMSGIRDMSVLEEAPTNRQPVQTYVLEHEPAILHEAIRRELRRGGQVFYLHNNTESINAKAVAISEAIPEAKIAVAHGKMSEHELSDIWARMLNQEINVLVCTTIIETGIDLPNANTLIIENADNMGLSQLHQLRGRVGRSSRRAYAYFTFNPHKVLSDISQRRLNAIREFTEFGSGYKIAMRDLELRGAGNILSGQQHGHMEDVGYDMYLKLLNEAVKEEKGEIKPTDTNECTVDIQMDAHIPDSYIESLSLRLDAYKRIADIKTPDDYDDVVDELCDRYGDMPQSVIGLCDIALTRNKAKECGIYDIRQSESNIILKVNDLKNPELYKLIGNANGKAILTPSENPYITLKVDKNKNGLSALTELFWEK